jgi:hypothetical protein
MKRRLLVAAMLIGLAGAPGVGPAAAQERLDAAAIAAARDLLNATDFFAQWQSTADLTMEATLTTINQAFEREQGRPFPPDLDREVRQVLREHNATILAELRPHVLDDAARIYARYFTAEEIRELQRLQAHPVMVKFQRIAPAFLAELTQLGLDAAVRRGPELRARIDQIMAAWLRRNARHNAAPRS